MPYENILVSEAEGIITFSFFFSCYGDHRDLHGVQHSFPTRRSSDPVLLVLVERRVPLARRGTPRAPDVLHASGRADLRRLLEPMAEGPPRAHVLRLFLRPHDLLERRIRGDERRDELEWERVELLDARDRDGRRARAKLVGDDVVVDLPAAEDEPPDGAVIGRG